MSDPAAATTSRHSAARWAVAAIATGALVVSGSGLVAFAQSGAGESQGTAFPGFADAGSFDMKVDEIIGGLGAQMGLAMPEGDLIGDVMTGEIGLALGDLESMMMGGDPALLIGMALADADAAGSMVEALVAGAGSFTESSYDDVSIYTDSVSSDPPMSVAVHSDWMLLGTGEEMVQSSLDVLAGSAPSLAEGPDFQTAWGRLPDARLGAVYMNLAPLAGLLDMATMVAGAQTGVELPSDDLAALLPKDMAGSLVAERDRLNLEILVSPPEGESTDTGVMRESDLALSFPGDTQVYLEMPDFGAGFQATVEQALATLEAQDMSMVDDSLGMGLGEGLGDIEALVGEESPLAAMLGAPLPEFLDFAGDTGVGAGLSSDGLWLGIAADVVDVEAATERVTSILTVLRMLLLSDESAGVGMETTEVGGVEVTTITLPIDQLMAESGVPIAVGDSIDVALTDDKLLIGLGDFVENAIMADPADSLGANAGYTDALAGDTVNAGVTYVNVGSLLAALDPMLAMMGPEWEMIAPYATAVDRMIVVPSVDDEVSRARLSVIVGQ